MNAKYILQTQKGMMHSVRIIRTCVVPVEYQTNPVTETPRERFSLSSNNENDEHSMPGSIFCVPEDQR